MLAARAGVEDGTIVFARDGESGLERVSAEGGTPEAFTTLDASRHESSHRLPELLPGGQAVIFTVKTDETQTWDDARIEAVSLRTRKRSVLITGGNNARYAGGHLIYRAGGGAVGGALRSGTARGGRALGPGPRRRVELGR